MPDMHMDSAAGTRPPPQQYQLNDDERAFAAAITAPLTERVDRLQEGYTALAARAAAPPSRPPEGMPPDAPMAAAARRMIGEIVARQITGGMVTGPTADLLAEAGLAPNQIPLSVLHTALGMPEPPPSPLAQLGDDGTPAAVPALGDSAAPAIDAAASTVTAAGHQETQHATVPMVFPSIMSEAFGVRRMPVPAGAAKVPVVTAPDSAVPTSYTAVGTDVGDSAVTVGVVDFTPNRLQISALIGQDTMRLFPGIGGDVTATLAGAISAALDYQVLYQSDSGLLAAGTAPTATTTVATYAELWGALAGRIDGTYARHIGEVNALLGPATMALAEGLYRTGQSEMPVTSALMARGCHVGSSGLVKAAAGDNQEYLTYQAGPAQHAAVQAVWDAVDITDVYTESQSGQIRVTMAAYTDFAVLRAGRYQRHAAHLA